MLKLIPVAVAIALAAIWHTATAGLIMIATLFGVAMVAMYQGTKD